MFCVIRKSDFSKYTYESSVKKLAFVHLLPYSHPSFWYHDVMVITPSNDNWWHNSTFEICPHATALKLYDLIFQWSEVEKSVETDGVFTAVPCTNFNYVTKTNFTMVALCLPEFVDLLRLNFSFIVMLLHWGFWSETSYLILKMYQILRPSSCLAWCTCSLRLFSSKNICVSKRKWKLRPKNCGGQDYCCLLSATATCCGCCL